MLLGHRTGSGAVCGAGSKLSLSVPSYLREEKRALFAAAWWPAKALQGSYQGPLLGAA